MIKKLLIVIVLVVVLGVGGLLAYLNLAFPKVGPARDHKVAATPELVERGRYLANHVNVCIDCHSTRDWKRYAGPITPGTEGKGGELFSREFGFPGQFYSKNITPTGISSYTDGELERLITTGVAKDGRAMFPVMPYPNYANMCQGDVDALIAYLRTLPPLPGEYPAAELDFPMNLIVKTIPKEVPRPECPKPPSAGGDVVTWGKYVANAASCIECHTKSDKGKKVGAPFAGGFEFALPVGTVVSANITPDAETGIGSWNKEVFLARFRGHASIEEPEVKKGEMQTVMPWQMYGGMSEEDLGALFEYLRTVPPAKATHAKWTPK